MAVRADVETAITSVIDCYFGECNCSTKTSAEMRQHRRAEIVYDQISDDEVTKYGEQFHAIRDGPYLRWKENETGPSNNGDGGGGDLTGHSDRAMFQAGKNVTIVSMLSWFL